MKNPPCGAVRDGWKVMNQYYPEGYLTHTARNAAALASEAALTDAMNAHTVLEARAILCDKGHNLHVDLGCMQGIIPREEGAIGIREGEVRDIALISRVNKPISFLVTEIRTDSFGERYAVLSRRLAQEQCRREYVSRLVPGDVIEARVTHLEGFGAFVDIGVGINALIPVDAISVSRIPHPSERFCTGEDIRAVVRQIDPETGRITLTHKELLGTWEENAARFSAGETVPGVVRSVERYGIFVELAPNLAGLAEYAEGVRPGQSTSVYIKSILPQRMKIKLIIVDAFSADYPPAPVEYFFEGNHMDEWRYSPPGAHKEIRSVFKQDLQAEPFAFEP